MPDQQEYEQRAAALTTILKQQLRFYIVEEARKYKRVLTAAEQDALELLALKVWVRNTADVVPVIVGGYIKGRQLMRFGPEAEQMRTLLAQQITNLMLQEATQYDHILTTDEKQGLAIAARLVWVRLTEAIIPLAVGDYFDRIREGQRG